MSDNTTELRLKGSSTIIGYIQKFSATEKAIFGGVSITLIISAIWIASLVNSQFMTEVPADGGSLREGLIGLPHTINPILAITDADRDIAALVYSGLTRYAGEAMVPDLAESWDISPDGLTYTFNLREDITFHNGAPLTAEDVIFTIEKIKDPLLKSPRAADWAGVTATSTSPTQVKFVLKQPYSSFMVNTTIGIIPKEIWGRVSDEQFMFSEFNSKPVGSGPYVIKSITRDEGGIPTKYELERWDDYYGDMPHISSVVFSFFPDLDHALNAIENGSIDSLSSVPPAIAKELATNTGEPYTIATSPLTRIFGVFFNQNKNAVLTDLNVRRALSISVDRNSLIDSVLYGYGIPVSSAFPAGFEVGSSTQGLEADIDGAREILEKSGWKLGSNGIYYKPATKKTASTTLSFTLYTADTPDLKQSADILKAAWRNLGVDVSVKVFEPNELYQNVIKTREYDALLFGEAIGKAGDLYAFWHSSQRNSPGLNVAMYTNSKADKILETIRASTSTEERISNYENLNQIISADVPAVFLYSPELTYIVPKKLLGNNFAVVSTPYDRFGNIGDWYLKTEMVWKIFANN